MLTLDADQAFGLLVGTIAIILALFAAIEATGDWLVERRAEDRAARLVAVTMWRRQLYALGAQLILYYRAWVVALRGIPVHDLDSWQVSVRWTVPLAVLFIMFISGSYLRMHRRLDRLDAERARKEGP